MLKAFCEERVGKALDRLSHIRHTSTVFTLFYRLYKLFTEDRKLLILDKTVVYRDKIVGKKEEKKVERKTFKGLLKRIFKRF